MAPICFAAALWSNASLGPWLAIGFAIAVLVVLSGLSSLLPPARRSESWAARATYGERIWMNRLAVPVCQADARPVSMLSLAGITGMAVMAGGAWLNDPVILGGGLAVYLAARFVFFDRLGALYVKMKGAHPLYRFWAMRPDNDNSVRRRAASH
ncbi:hypothetical protein GCM10011316_28570 [Roseibium aquae]|uniref:Uncharacterized protein n=2 Tax=Roseibium aquae TaxID=1323746 RepID=A0A916TM58_9HYPH|nr:DUF6653 family protein [Roseibium aquae]GGB54787.1 hypothetical protein GCM10011316_28570 [Roseibium aquae]